MQEFTIRYLFPLGSLVCLKAHAMMPSEGRPLIGRVNAIEATIVEATESHTISAVPKYCMRWISPPPLAWVTPRQSLPPTPTFLESELVAYDKSLDDAADAAMEGDKS